MVFDATFHDYKIGMCCLSANNAALRRKSRPIGSESE
jgi:hypothetical protein